MGNSFLKTPGGFGSDENRNNRPQRDGGSRNTVQGNKQNPYARTSETSQYNHGQQTYYDQSELYNNDRDSYESYEEEELYGNPTPPYRYEPEPQPEKKNTVMIVMICVLAFLLIAGAAFITVWLLIMKNNENKQDGNTTPTPVQTAVVTPTEIEGDIVIQNETPTPVIVETTTPPPAVVTQSPTPTETQTPTPPPTPTPTPPPTSVPSSFTFGGATIPAGTKEITGTKAGFNFNGDSKGHFTHITKEEVETMVKLCPNLRVLDVDFCWFDTYEPLKELTELEYLELKTCGNSSGGVALTNIDWISGLTNLKHLNLCHNKIYDISPIENLDQLEWLSVADNGIDDSDLKYIKNLTSLKTLYLYTNNLKDVSALSSLKNLELLNVGNNKNIKTVKSLTGLKKLVDLKVFGTAIDDLSYFKNFARLTRVDLAGCKKLVFDDYYYDLPKCPKLKLFIVGKNDTEGILAGDALFNEESPLQYQIK